MVVDNGLILRNIFSMSARTNNGAGLGEDRRPDETLEAEPDGHRMGAALVGLHGGLPAHDRGHPHAMVALAHCPRGQQTKRPAKPIRHLLDSIPYKKIDVDLPKIPVAKQRPEGATNSLRDAGQPIPSHY